MTCLKYSSRKAVILVLFLEHLQAFGPGERFCFGVTYRYLLRLPRHAVAECLQRTTSNCFWTQSYSNMLHIYKGCACRCASVQELPASLHVIQSRVLFDKIVGISATISALNPSFRALLLTASTFATQHDYAKAYIPSHRENLLIPRIRRPVLEAKVRMNPFFDVTCSNCNSRALFIFFLFVCLLYW